ncbi:hypothetical protein HQN90_35815 [Paenibacillus alba]|uniref:hypothetical protein n=1 Tax=Paenibacillus alba TaxID=1197127 RepID=UPI001566E942|nr:hypothetical protein [Paenibacillus alba]NQX71466.1 hypothetical protein [Paenibacillus alba]
MTKNRYILVGLMLILLSIYPYFLIWQEGHIEAALNKKYSIISIKAPTNQLVLNENKVEIIEEKKGDLSNLQIKVNDQIIGSTRDAKLINSPMDLYYGWIGFLNVKDKKSGKNDTIIVQRLDPYSENMPPINIKNKEWNLYHIDENKNIQTEHITFNNRKSHDPVAIKEIMVGGTSLGGIGYKSNLRYLYPTIFFPVIFPYGFFWIGLLIVAFSLLNRFLKKSA